MITYNIQLRCGLSIGSSGSGVFQKAKGDQRKKSPLPPGYKIHIQSPNESKCRISCCIRKSKTRMDQNAPWQKNPTAKIGRAFNLRPPLVRFVDLLVY
ncbi:unnamed protein product [Penicillium camemberti]|uniref:Str. FM013 n=1 Tax=Penicillium camemberti (strain FM 013) TaxID=1429867 RepID=A0A0G4P9I4_PENC3|nr:unnamed protein product [Penicillium camemberti]